jgi:transmembrane sensor
MTSTDMSDPSVVGREMVAGQWLLRLQEDVLSESEVLEWIDWCESDPKNMQTFERMQALWHASAAHPPEPERLVKLTQGDLVSSNKNPPRQRFGGARIAIAASMVIVCVTAALLVKRPVTVTLGSNEVTRISARVESVQTPLAANRRATLPDGSDVEIGARSILDLNFTGSQRRLRLRDGQAYFSVKHDAEHPFIVNAGGIDIVAVGTAFDVRRSGAEVTVNVQEGIVEVVNTSGKGDAVRAGAGYQIVVDTKSGRIKESPVDTAVALGWRAGRLEFTGDSLDVVLASVNRYSANPIVLGDPTLGKLVFTGTIFVDSIDASLDAMQQVFPIEVRRIDRQLVIVRRP